MTFAELLNKDIEALNCSTKDLSASSGLSESVLSRYKSGMREPATNSTQLSQLLRGLHMLAGENDDYDLIKLEERYICVLDAQTRRNRNFTENFRKLVDALHVNMKVLSSEINYDVSFLYRIKSGERMPNDLDGFVLAASEHIAQNYCSASDIQLISKLLATKSEKLRTAEDRAKLIQQFLLYESKKTTVNAMASFLQRMDEFNLDEYIEAIHFNDIKIPKVPFQLPTNKNYYGIKQMREAELDFFKTTVLSKNMDPIFMNSDMPILEAAEDMDFNKKWMFGIAASLRKGLHINIIHHLDRPFEELLLGLEAWIPIYMTGLVSPYYLPNIDTKVFHRMLYTSGAAVLTGECIDGHYADGRLSLSNSKEDIQYQSKRAAHLLSKAKPLMKIYDETMQKEFDAFSQKISELNYHSPKENAFRNIAIKCYDDAEPFVVISKETHPHIHFVIYHPMLVDALNNFMVVAKE